MRYVNATRFKIQRTVLPMLDIQNNDRLDTHHLLSHTFEIMQLNEQSSDIHLGQVTFAKQSQLFGVKEKKRPIIIDSLQSF